ncbi:DegT/DnrJ/EryC1/StrS aminotransferase family protein [Peptococcaceae bacterium 1198_IL3148]
MPSKLFTDEDKNALLSVLQSEKLHLGEQVNKFEQAFADYVGVKHAVAVSSAAAGLHISLLAAAVGPSEEVIVSPIAPVAGPNAVFYQKGVNTFADVDPSTGNVDAKDVVARINDKTKAVLVHHYAGNPCDLQPVLDGVKDRDIAVIVDASHGLGAQYRGRSVASWGDMVVFSFGPGNHIYTGDGGMIATNSADLAQWLRMFRDEGLVKDPHLLTKDIGLWHYEMQDLGYAYRMTELQAALGLSQLERIDQIIQRRTAIAYQYNDAFGALPQLQIPQWQPDTIPAWGMYPLQLKSAELVTAKRKIFAELKASGIDVDVQYYPVFSHPYYLWAGHPDICTLEGSRAPKAEEFYQRVLLLPINHSLADREIKPIIDTTYQVINKIFNKQNRP